MIKQVSIMAASVTLLAACSSFQPAEPSIGTLGDESTIAKHHFHDGSSVMVEDVKSHRAGVHTDNHAGGKSEENMGTMMNNMSRVLFSFDSASLSADARTKLAAIAKKISNSSSHEIIVEGHADERGTREYNLSLGDRRAVAIKKYLVGLGVASSKLNTISYGKERPANPAHNEKAWNENRRGVVNIK